MAILPINKMSAEILKDYDTKKVGIRPAVVNWTYLMEDRLQAKDKQNKHGWLDGNLQYYVVRIFECWKEAVQAIQYPKILELLVSTRKTRQGIKDHDDISEKDIELCIKKCVDASNWNMMLATNLINILKIRKGLKK